MYFPQITGTAGQARPPAGTKPTRGSTWAQAGKGRAGDGEGPRSPARPPACRPQLPSCAAPPPSPAGQSRTSAVWAHEPQRHQAERDPTVRAWHRARTRTTRAGQSATGYAQPQARSRAGLTRENPPTHTRRRRARPSPMRTQARACNCRPPRPHLRLPHPQRRRPGVGGLGCPTRPPTVPKLLSV